MNRIHIILLAAYFISCNSAFNSLNCKDKINLLNEKGVKHGIWIEEEVESGIKYFKVYHYKNGLKHGKYRSYRDGFGLAAEGQYRYDVKIGTWKGYYKGCITGLVKYENGEGKTVKTFHCPF